MNKDEARTFLLSSGLSDRQIDVIEQAFLEPCEDAISRQAAIDTIESWLSCDDYNEAELHIMRAMQSVLYDLPSVKPQEPKTGHWNRISIDKYSEHAKYWYECDKCGKHNLGNTNFCPNCGAKMVEPQERSEKE